MAGYSDDLCRGTARLAELWSDLTAGRVYRAGPLAMLGNGRRLLADTALGRFLGAERVQAMLDAAPLRRLLAHELPLDGTCCSIPPTRGR